MITDERICNRGLLKVKVKNINEVPEEEYAMLRKESFGGSDASILCGVNLYKTMDQLITEKNSKFITEEEKEVGNKPIVRKGRDLEPIILDKASKELGIEITKPTSMYEFLEAPILTLNYDGVCEKGDILIPVEAKLVSKWGEKYYNKEKTLEENADIDMKIEGDTLEAHIKRKALRIGIPAYYYTQVQQELMGLSAPYGYLAVLFDESWDFKLYLVKADEYVQNKIYDIADKNKDKIEKNS
jgi:predicted phage-related endonuclease